MFDPYISEIRYRAPGATDFLEFVVAEGADVSNIQIVVYNPNGTVRTTNAITNLVDTVNGKDVYLINAATSPTFNGINRNGAVAVVINGVVEDFVSFENIVTASNGPAAGQTSTSIGVAGNGASLETSNEGGSYETISPPTPGTLACFLTGTLILTPKGYKAIESLRPGDLVISKDNGPVEIKWHGQRTLSPYEITDISKRPIRIPAGCLGQNVPMKDLYLSPNHRVAIDHYKAELIFGDTEVFVTAKSLVGFRGIGPAPVAIPITYHHLLLPAHDIIWANAMPSESFHLAQLAVEGFDDTAYAQINIACPELKGDFKKYGPTARLVLRSYEARYLLSSIVPSDTIIEHHGDQPDVVNAA